MYKTPPKTPPNQYPSRSESDIQKLYYGDTNMQGNITQRAKRRCLSGGDTGEELDAFKNEIKKMLDDMMTAQNSRLDKLENHFIEIKNHYTEIKATNNELEKTMTLISDQLQSVEVKVKNLEKERSSMAIKLSTLEEKIESLDRNLVKTSIEIRNVPKRNHETKIMLSETLMHLSKQLEADMEPTSIRDITRQPSKKEALTSNLLVEFSNTLEKTKFLTAVKNYNKLNASNKLNSAHLNFSAAQKTPIYIAEQLTPLSKRLFYLTRLYAKSHQFSYCWTSNGRVFLKKDSDSQSIVVKNEDQLKQLPLTNNA